MGSWNRVELKEKRIARKSSGASDKHGEQKSRDIPLVRGFETADPRRRIPPGPGARTT